MGLSFLIPNIDVKHAKEQVEILIEEINKKVLREKGIKIKLRIRMSTSWIEMRVVTEEQVELI